ncbi:MAG: phosphotransferase family protein, partial [Saprospiraceae bacterium]|nr:phosphotransferase family protein [Saprospiraceae bacterium]
MPNWIDEAGPIRSGEELDGKRLETYLKENITGLETPIAVEQFPRGYSNLTYLIHAGKRELVLRRPPFGANIKSAHDMHREYRILSGLKDIYPKAAVPYLYCEDESIVGAPFYVMERKEGVILRPQMPLGMVPPPDTMRKIADSFIDTMVELHSVDYKKAGLAKLGHPEGYVERQITGWAKRYEKAKTQKLPKIDQLAKWLLENIPEESSACLIHNDFKYDNLVLDPEDWTSVIAVLDWEMATIGDPFMDLGSSLGYWINPDDPPFLHDLQLSPTTVKGNPTRAEVVNQYCLKADINIKDPVFYFAYGLLKVAVIAQQIYYRYRKG